MANAPTIPITCRLNVWHKWQLAFADDGVRFVRCSRCGKDKPDRTGGPPDTIGL
jgi:hypothetical protein